MTSAETSNCTSEVLIRQCTKTSKKSLGRKHTHSQLALSQKMVEREKILDRWAQFISELFEDHRKDYIVNCNEAQFC